MDIFEVRKKILDKRYSFYKHALIEGKKDGLTPEDAIAIILTGKIVEEYPERKRILIYGTIAKNIPVHVVCDYSNQIHVFITTMYIPDSCEWINYQIRRKR